MKRLVTMALGVILAGIVNVNVCMAAETRTVTASANSTEKELQTLLDENKDGQYELTVVIPAGTYYLDRSLYVYPNTTIRATGARLVKQRNYGAMIEAKLTADDGGYDANHDITIDGGTWDSEPLRKNGDGTETFRFIHSNNITIKNANLCNVPEGSHLIVLAGVQNATVSKCKFYGYGKNWKTAKTPKEALQLDTVHSIVEVPTNQKAEVLNWDDLPCDNITVTGCEFYNYSRGIGSHTAVAGRFHTNVTIVNNKFHDLSDSAIRMYNYKDAQVKNNTINNAIEGILAYTYMEEANDNSFFKPNNGKVGTLPKDYNITISGNTITNMKSSGKTWGDAIRVIGAKQRPMSGVDITGNTITTTGRYGIFATAAPNLTISGNEKISATKSDGILVEVNSKNAKIYGNTVTKAGVSGISIYNSDGAAIYSNKISAAKGYGIYVIQSKNCKIGTTSTTGNTITNPGKTGIYLTTTKGQKTGCTSAKVQYNTVTNAAGDGIGAYMSKSVKINNNTISAKQNGIYINTKSEAANISANTITSAGRHGIWISSKSKRTTVSDNTIKKYARSGNYNAIYVYQSGGSSAKKATKITGNKITGSGKSKNKHAIRLSDSAYSLVEKNVVNAAPGTGIYVYMSKNCTINKNTVSGSKDRGIYLTTKCDNAVVTQNTVKKSADVGIATYQAPKSKLTGNKVTARKGVRGIWVSQSNNTQIKSNTISGAKKIDALVVSGSTGCKSAKNKIK